MAVPVSSRRPESLPARAGWLADLRGLDRRLRVRGRRGFALLDALLALALAGVAVLAANTWIEVQKSNSRARDAGRTVAVLADAARMHVQANYERLTGGSRIALSTLRNDSAPLTLRNNGVLPANFSDADEMKRELAVVALSITDGVRVLAGQTPDAGDDRRPHAALTQGQAGQRLGMVQDCGGSRCLVGPGVNEDISAFNGQHGLPDPLRVGAVMALYEYSHRDFCGDFLHRVRTDICTNANVMAQPLTVGGRLRNVATIGDVNTLVVNGALTVRGKLETTERTGEFIAYGRMTVGAGMTVDKLTIQGRLNSNTTNPACKFPNGESLDLPPALCSEDRVIVGNTLTVEGTADVRGPARVEPEFHTVAGGIRTPVGCIKVRGTADVEGRARVSGNYSASGAGSCP